MSRLVGTLPNPGQGSELAGLKPWLKNAKIGHFQTLEMTNFPTPQGFINPNHKPTGPKGPKLKTEGPRRWHVTSATR
jgi:hypothetical protein